MKSRLIALGAVATMAIGASVLVAPAAWAAPMVDRSISVGETPTSVAFSPDGATAYVTSYLGKDVSVINVEGGWVDHTIDIGYTLTSIAISPDGTLAYATAPVEDAMVVIDLESEAVTTIPVGPGASAVAFNPSGSFAYVTHQKDYGTVSVIDVANGTVLDPVIDVGAYPSIVKFSPDGSVAYVNNGNSSITVIDATAHAVRATIDVGSPAGGIAFTPDSTKAFVALYTGQMAIIDVQTSSIDDTFAFPDDAAGMDVSPDGSTLYVTLRYSSQVAVVDVGTNTIIDRLTVGNSPAAVTFSPNGAVAYVVNNYSNDVSVIRPAGPKEAISSSAVSASVIPGSLDAWLGNVAFDQTGFRHDGQMVRADVELSADDQTGLMFGWNVTLQASDLVWTSPSSVTDPARNIPGANLSVALAGEVTTTTGEAFTGATLEGRAALGSPASVFSTTAGHGSGAYTVPLTMYLTIPANAATGNYVGTLTTTISAAP
jgi:YVTN family beta-propeller protein